MNRIGPSSADGGRRAAGEPAAAGGLAGALVRVVATTDHIARRARDPVSVVHRFEAPADREIVALLASSVAFGNVTSILRKLDDALARIGPSPALACDDAATLTAALRGWVHRVYRGEDVAALLVGARRVQRASGSLGRRMADELARHKSLRPALTAWVGAVREAGGLELRGRAGRHLLPDPQGASACKRLLLFLRWMVRPADGVDLGLWSAEIAPSTLLVPVDTHIHRLGSNLGLTSQPSASWRAAEDITRRLAAIDPSDPVRFDFALCHLGMVQRCPSRPDPARCEGCGIQPLCVHWAPQAREMPAPMAARADARIAGELAPRRAGAPAGAETRAGGVGPPLRAPRRGRLAKR